MSSLRIDAGRGPALAAERFAPIHSNIATAASPTLCGPGTRAVGLSEALDHTVGLWQRSLRGQGIRTTDLIKFHAATSHNDLKLLLDREYFHALLPALAAAQDSIHIAMLTFDSGNIGQSVANLLIQKKLANPRLVVRIILDGWGSSALTALSNRAGHLKRMRAAGIEIMVNNVFNRGLEHRKIVVLDGRSAFMSGTCIGDEYYGSKTYWAAYRQAAQKDPAGAKALWMSKHDPNVAVPPNFARLDAQPDMPIYHDYGYECRGDVVAALQVAFLQSWFLHERQLEPGLSDQEMRERYFPKPCLHASTQLKVINSIPGGVSEIAHGLFEVVDGATQTLDLTFAYILVPQFVDSLERAAKRGVKVRILVPGEKGTDMPMAFYAFRQEYPQLFATGNVEIYEYKQYTHIKLMVADHALIFASTGNPEWDSWERSFDQSLVFQSPEMAALIERNVFAKDYAPDRALQVTLQEYQRMSLWQRVRMRVSRLLFDTFFRVRRRDGATPALLHSALAAKSA